MVLERARYGLYSFIRLEKRRHKQTIGFRLGFLIFEGCLRGLGSYEPPSKKGIREFPV
jgi:hypothetical protein